MSIEPSTTGAAITVGVIVPGALGGVAQANLRTIPPKAQATKTPANISFHFILLMVTFLSSVCSENLAAVGSDLLGQRRCQLWPSERRTARYFVRVKPLPVNCAYTLSEADAGVDAADTASITARKAQRFERMVGPPRKAANCRWIGLDQVRL
jgi:hypothetical protein